MTADASSAPTLVPGYMLDRYELLCPVAQGGMASVWVARLRGKHGFAKLFAIKTILPEYSSDDRFQRMFLDEARIASRIEHTNVAQIIDLGEQAGTLYLVMEWVDGDSLSRLFRTVVKEGGETLPLPVVLRVVADACAGLHAAHELRDEEGHLLNVVHRDVSPQNVLLSTKGLTKVIDFGVVKARDRVADETNAGTLKGKLQYMAPEQAMGRNVDRRADVWALGAMLYQLIAGRLPFEAESPLSMLHLITSGKPPPPMGRDVPKPIAQIVVRALSIDRDKRYATAADMGAAIEDAMIETQTRATTQDVANYGSRFMNQFAQTRRDAISHAMLAVGEKTPPPVGSSSLTESGVTEALRANGPSSASETGTLSLSDDMDLRTQAAAPKSLRQSMPDGDAPPPSLDVPSTATLGSATVAAPAKRGRRPLSPLVAVACACAAGAIVGALALVIVSATQRQPVGAPGLAVAPPAAIDVPSAKADAGPDAAPR